MKNRGIIELIKKQTGETYSFDLGRLRATRGFCPGCHDRRTDKSNRSFRWNAEKGYGFCYYCNEVYFDKDRAAYNPGRGRDTQRQRPVNAVYEKKVATVVVEVEFEFFNEKEVQD